MTGFNPFSSFEGIQKVGKEMKQIQEKLEALTAQGSAGGNFVKITIDGKREVRKVEIDPLIVDPKNVKMLEDLIRAAFISASQAIEEKIQQEIVSSAELRQWLMNNLPGAPSQ